MKPNVLLSQAAAASTSRYTTCGSTVSTGTERFLTDQTIAGQPGRVPARSRTRAPYACHVAAAGARRKEGGPGLASPSPALARSYMRMRPALRALALLGSAVLVVAAAPAAVIVHDPWAYGPTPRRLPHDGAGLANAASFD